MGGQVDSSLKRHGGKHFLAKKINQLFQPHKVFVDLYCGACSVLFDHEPDNTSEVANDLDGTLLNFWQVLQSPKLFERFKRQVEATPFSEELYNRATIRKPTNEDEMVQVALDFFIINRQSRQALGKDFASLTKNRLRRGMNEQVSSWLSAIDGLPEVHARLQRVLLLNRPALKVIENYDTPETLFYADPPYLHQTRSTTNEYGEFEMSDADHVKLLHTLSKIKGKFVLSGYPSDLYETARMNYGWKQLDMLTPNHASSSKVKEEKTERVWYNF